MTTVNVVQALKDSRATMKTLRAQLVAERANAKTLRMLVKDERASVKAAKATAKADKAKALKASRVARIAKMEARLEALRLKAFQPKTRKRVSRKASKPVTIPVTAGETRSVAA